MASIVVAGNTSGTVTLSAPDIAGTTTLTLPTTNGTLVTTATGQTLTSPVLTNPSISSGGLTFSDSSTQTAAASPYVLKNRIINGDMRIDQRNAGAAITTDGSFPVDRFKLSQNTDGACSVQQDSSAPAGFVNSIKYTTTTADSSLTTTQNTSIAQNIEGLNISDLDWGTANAKTITLSFWVRSSLTGTFGGSITNSAVTRCYPFSYTILTANTWEQKTVTITGDTSGTWLTTNGIGMRVIFGLGVGPDRSGTAGAWTSSAIFAPTGATSVIGTNAATWYITGVQLEIGSSATPFERRLVGQEILNCQRYYYRLTAPSSGSMLIFSGINAGSTSQLGSIYLPASMRAIPTLSAGANAWGLTRNNGSFTTYATNSVPSIANSTTQLAYFYAVVASGLTGATMGTTYIELGNWIDFSAEL